MIPSSTAPLPPSSSGPPYSTNAGSSPSSTPAGAVSTGTGQLTVRQPQATMNPPSTSPETIWSANSQTARATPPSTMSAGTSLLPIAVLLDTPLLNLILIDLFRSISTGWWYAQF